MLMRMNEITGGAKTGSFEREGNGKKGKSKRRDRSIWGKETRDFDRAARQQNAETDSTATFAGRAEFTNVGRTRSKHTSTGSKFKIDKNKADGWEITLKIWILTETAFVFQSDISDVNQIFKDLGAMVHDQGEVLDSIEASVERTEVFVNEGSQQLRTAATYQNKLRKKKCILVLIGAIALSILIAVIVWQSS